MTENLQASFSAEEILEITGGRLAQGLMPDEAAEICTDSRDLKEGAWFVALSGERYDGHDFIGDAFAAGALGCIVAERGSYPIAATSFPLIAVKDTMEALETLARNWRRRISPKVIAVAGRREQPISNITLMLSQVLSEFAEDAFKFVPPSTLLSLGESLKSLLAIEETTRYLLAELTPSSISELTIIARSLQPNIVVITSSGFANLQGEGGEDDVISAHGELLANMDSRLRVAFIEDPPGGALKSFISYYPGRVDVFDRSQSIEPIVDFIDGLSQQDVWCVLKVCRELGIDDETIKRTLARSMGSPSR